MTQRMQGRTPTAITRNQWLALKQAAEPFCACCGAGAGHVRVFRPEEMDRLVALGLVMREVSSNPREGRLTNAGRAFVEEQLG